MKTIIISVLVSALCLLGGSKGYDDPYLDDVLRIRIINFYGSADSMVEDGGADEPSGRGDGAFWGHSFIELKNISGSYLQVGLLGFGNNSSMTIGCFPGIESGGNPVSGSDGIWYNRESWEPSGQGFLSLESQSLTTTIDELGRAVIADIITTAGNSYYNLLTHNCTHLAVQIWNAVAPSYWTLSPTIAAPSTLRTAITNKAGHGTNVSFTCGSTVGYVDGNPPSLHTTW